MGDAGYRGVSADQDSRFGNKDRKLIKQLESSKLFPPSYSKKVDLRKVNLEVMKPWVESKTQELLGFEDEVVVEYVMGMLESEENQPHPNPRQLQLSLTGFLESSTPKFMAELWDLLLSAQESIGGIPQQFVDKKKEEMRAARERDAAAIRASGISGGAAAMGRGPPAALPPRPAFAGQRGGGREFRDKRGNATERVRGPRAKIRAGPSGLRQKREERRIRLLTTQCPEV
ncbi:PWI domain-containing protein [Microstroma glucosiphilum]|uniref:PWI domain-containing protein n=1 Tax=Pseudomicrostroma glucosiphilum TaxID=1684307 RepID=A0A316UDX3_9BASI|nr:PWI domain-containing protein [Pseudomicrostroma glucosiphilum]PWN23372.1 PWI domain-containing protein [Pseudomicrostroma glucosiphilum]